VQFVAVTCRPGQQKCIPRIHYSVKAFPPWCDPRPVLDIAGLQLVAAPVFCERQRLAMGTALLTDFAAESGSSTYSTAQSLVSAVLARPFWTEVAEHSAHSWKLHKALKYAEDCRVPAMSYLIVICDSMITGP